jgi:hypothetical protein
MISALYANNECVYFINKIGYYNNNVAPRVLRIKGLESTESLLLEYKKTQEEKKLMNELTIYLNSFTLIREKYLYISPSCIYLQKVNNSKIFKESFLIKNKFYGDILVQFNQAYSKYIASTKFIDIEAKACEGYGNKATKFISDFYKSTKQEDIDWINQSIKKFEDCKKDEYQKYLNNAKRLKNEQEHFVKEYY